MYKDENGLFMLKQSYPHGYYDTLKEMLRIVLPNSNGKFTQISREGKGQCEVKELKENVENFDILYKFVKEHGDGEGMDGFKLREVRQVQVIPQSDHRCGVALHTYIMDIIILTTGNSPSKYV